MMERRALLALVLTFAIMALWTRFFAPVPPEATSPAPEAQVEAPAQPEAPPPPLGEPPREDLPVEVSPVDAGVLRGSFTSAGGGPERLELSAYRHRTDHGGLINWLWGGIKHGALPPIGPGEDLPPVVLLDDGQDATSALALSLDGTVGASRTVEEVVEASRQAVTYRSTQGAITVLKRYTLTPGAYSFKLDVTLRNDGDQEWQGRPTLSVVERLHSIENARTEGQSWASYVDDAAEFEVGGDVTAEEPGARAGAVTWYGFGDNYFISLVVPSAVQSGTVEARRVGEAVAVGAVPSAPVRIAPGASTTLSYKVFAGPKEIELLKAEGAHLDRAIDFGFFSFFAYPLLWLLRELHALVGSYGVAIILLTLSMKALTFPLTQKSMESMQRMKEIQPELKKLQDKYADNRETLNQETMRLMSERKVNPLGGCLPTLVQLPVWFALYRVLQGSVELYRQPFLYLKDLSAADPYGISPILLGVLMVVQQRMTPSTSADPVQQRMLQLMPIFFSFIMFGLPSGLVVYILVNSVLTIVHQTAFNRLQGA